MEIVINGSSTYTDIYQINVIANETPRTLYEHNAPFAGYGTVKSITYNTTFKEQILDLKGYFIFKDHVLELACI